MSLLSCDNHAIRLGHSLWPTLVIGIVNFIPSIHKIAPHQTSLHMQTSLGSHIDPQIPPLLPKGSKNPKISK